MVYLLFVQISCQKSDIKKVEDEEIIIPEGTGIDLDIDRTKIDNIIDKLNNPSEDYVLVASHRGGIYWESTPENTLAAFEKSIDEGVDIIEIDVRKTLDGHLVVMHDSDLNRVTTGSGKVADRTLSYIKSLSTINKDGNITDYTVPTLEETMLFLKGKSLVMIDKANDFFKNTHDILIETKTIDHALFIESYQLDDAQKKMGTYLFENSQYVPRIKETVDNINGYINPFLSQKAASAFEIRFSTETAHTIGVIPKLQQDKKVFG